jgi:hypothetical protein
VHLRAAFMFSVRVKQELRKDVLCLVEHIVALREIPPRIKVSAPKLISRPRLTYGR